MNARIFFTVVAVLTGIIPAVNAFHAEPQTSQTKSPSLLLVTGNDWQTCGDWKDWSETMKLGFVMGHAEGVSQVMTFLEPTSYARIKDGFSSSFSVKFGELRKAVDEFCGDYRNVKIPAVNAMMAATGSMAGYPAYDEHTMRRWRCIAVAGEDQNKIRDCSSQP